MCKNPTFTVETPIKSSDFHKLTPHDGKCHLTDMGVITMNNYSLNGSVHFHFISLHLVSLLHSSTLLKVIIIPTHFGHCPLTLVVLLVNMIRVQFLLVNSLE